jgi:isopentenyldiphosphate isomerase
MRNMVGGLAQSFKFTASLPAGIARRVLQKPVFKMLWLNSIAMHPARACMGI